MRNEIFVLKCQGTDGADLDAFGALAADGFSKRFVLEGGDHSFETSSRKSDSSDSQLLPAYPDTFAAENTFVWIVGKGRTTFVDGQVSFELSESFCRELYAKMSSDFLKFARAVF